jgi:hypothetical protein
MSYKIEWVKPKDSIWERFVTYWFAVVGHRHCGMPMIREKGWELEKGIRGNMVRTVSHENRHICQRCGAIFYS